MAISQTSLSTSRAAGQAGHLTDTNTMHGAVNDLTAIFDGWAPTDSVNKVAAVADYGAVGNGSADDTAAIDSARTALVAAGGGEMVFDRGKTYLVSKITISSKIRYNGNGCTVKGSSATPQGVFEAEGWGGATVTNDAEIVGFQIDVNTTAKRGVFLYLANRCRVLNNRIFNCATTTDSGVRLHLSTTDCTVRGNHITMATDNPFGTVASAVGIYLVSTTPDTQGGGQNNTLTFGAASALSEGHLIEGNHVYNGTHGIGLFGAQNCRVIGNFIKGQTHRSIIISPIAHRNVITGNTCVDFGSTGIHLAWGCLSNVITGNTCVTSVSTLELNGIKGYFGCSDNVVANNYVEGVGAGAVRFAMGSVGNLVANNRIKGCAIGVQFESYLSASYYQPTTPPGNDNNAAIGNLITGTPIGVSVEASGTAGLAGTTIRSNDIVSPATAGVQFTEANSQLVASVMAVGNKITGTPSSGLWVLPRGDTHFAQRSANSGLVDKLTAYVSGRYYGALFAGTTTRLTVTGTLYAVPFRVEAPITISRIGAEVSTVGAAGSIVRLGIFPDVNGTPTGAPILDAGTIAGDSATAQEITVSVTLQPGLYWLASKAESSGTYPTLRAISSSQVSVGTSTLISAVQMASAGYAPTGVATGAFGTFPASPINISTAPSIAVKIA